MRLARAWSKPGTWKRRVEFKGALPHGQALPLFSQACAFVQHSVTTSYGDAEGMPNSILEAQAAGLPVVSTRHAGIVNSVVEDETGFLVDERDIDGMADRMCRLLEDPDTVPHDGRQRRNNTSVRTTTSIVTSVACKQSLTGSRA